MTEERTAAKGELAVGEGVVIVGDVVFGEDCSVWHNAVIRGDHGKIRIGDRTNIQDNCVIHVEPDGLVSLGNDVTVGHGAILHGAIVGDNSLIGMGSIIMDNAVIGKNCLVAAGAIVPGGKTFPDGVMIMGAPAKVTRPLTEEEIAGISRAAAGYVKSKEDLTTVPR